MKRNKNTMIRLILMVSLLLLSGCAGKASQIADKKILASQGPSWTVKGSGAFNEDADNAFYGVGSASGIRNPALLRTTADNRARAEIARIFKTYTAALMKDYVASTMAGNPEETSEEQHVERSIKTFTRAELTGIEIVDHWQNPENEEYFSLARLDLDTFKIYLEKAEALSDRVRQKILSHAEKAFDDLAEEETRQE